MEPMPVPELSVLQNISYELPELSEYTVPLYVGQSLVDVEVGAGFEVVVDRGELVVGEMLDTELSSLLETIPDIKSEDFTVARREFVKEPNYISSGPDVLSGQVEKQGYQRSQKQTSRARSTEQEVDSGNRHHLSRWRAFSVVSLKSHPRRSLGPDGTASGDCACHRQWT